MLVVAWVVATGLKAYFSQRLLVVEMVHGQLVRASGKVPADFYREIVDVLERAKASGKVVVRLEKKTPVVVASSGIDANVAQRLRNVVGRFPVAKLRAGRPIRHRS
jgi:hypothetical protein